MIGFYSRGYFLKKTAGEKIALGEYSKKASGDQPEDENKDGKRKTKTS